MQDRTKLNIKMITDESTGLVRCVGLDQHARRVGLKVAKVSRETGIARNTVNKAIAGDPIRLSKAKHLIDYLGVSSNRIQDDKVIDLTSKRKSENLESEQSNPANMTQMLETATMASKELSGLLKAIFETANLEETNFRSDELSMLNYECKLIELTRQELAKKYKLDS